VASACLLRAARSESSLAALWRASLPTFPKKPTRADEIAIVELFLTCVFMQTCIVVCRTPNCEIGATVFLTVGNWLLNNDLVHGWTKIQWRSHSNCEIVDVKLFIEK
jgi:hypothetical protein